MIRRGGQERAVKNSGSLCREVRKKKGDLCMVKTFKCRNAVLCRETR